MTGDQRPEVAAIDVWIVEEFQGHGVAIRKQTDPPIPGEPFMSMADAKTLTRVLANRAAAIARVDENEECAKAAEDTSSRRHVIQIAGDEIAFAIRARCAA